MSRFMNKLTSALNELDGAFKETLEKDAEDPSLDSIADQRMQRRQRMDAAKNSAPFGSALSSSTTSTKGDEIIYSRPSPSATPSPPSGEGLLPPFGKLSSEKPLSNGEEGGEARGTRATSISSSASSLPSSSTIRGGGGIGGQSSPPPFLPTQSPPPTSATSMQDRAAMTLAAEGGREQREQHDPDITSTIRGTSSYDGLDTSITSSSSLSSPPLVDGSSASLRAEGGRRAGLSGGKGETPTNTTATTASNDKNNVSSSVRQLQKELKALNEENVDFERRILGQEKELKAAAEALAHTNAKAAAREEELLDELVAIKQAKDADKKTYQMAMASKEKSIENLESQLMGTKTELETYVLQVASLRREITNILEDKEGLRRDLDVSLSNQERGVEGLRAELKEAQATIDEMKMQHSAWMRQAQRREADLEGINAELTESIAAKQREMEILKASYHHMGDTSQTTDLELYRLHQELQATQAALELERQHVTTLQREIRAQQHELTSVQAIWREEKEAAQANAQRKQARIDELEKAVNEAQRLARETKTPLKEEMDGRLRMVSEELVKKQEQLDGSICEKYALEARLKSAEQRSKHLEHQLSEARGGGSGSGDYDLEGGVETDYYGHMRNRGSIRTFNGTPSTSSSSSHSSNTGLYKRYSSGSTSLRPMRHIEPLSRHPQVAEAVDFLDRLMITVGHYLRVYPIARLCFIIYLLILHLWAFFVLMFHSQRLEEIHSDTGGSFTNPTASTGIDEVAGGASR